MHMIVENAAIVSALDAGTVIPPHFPMLDHPIVAALSAVRSLSADSRCLLVSRIMFHRQQVDRYAICWAHKCLFRFPDFHRMPLWIATEIDFSIIPVQIPFTLADGAFGTDRNESLAIEV